MCGKPAYDTENTPSKRTSLRWGDDCPNIARACPIAAISKSLPASNDAKTILHAKVKELILQ